jgi:hypothetical protein
MELFEARASAPPAAFSLAPSGKSPERKSPSYLPMIETSTVWMGAQYYL